MPSTTPNYGWSYPISSDDLNAGATSIGSLATGADASLKAEATARAAADTTLTTAVNQRPTGTMANIDAGVYNVTTDANGVFTNPGGLSVDQCVCANAATSALYWYALVIDPYASNKYVVYGQYLTNTVPTAVASATVAFRRVSWS